MFADQLMRFLFIAILILSVMSGVQSQSRFKSASDSTDYYKDSLKREVIPSVEFSNPVITMGKCLVGQSYNLTIPFRNTSDQIIMLNYNTQYPNTNFEIKIGKDLVFPFDTSELKVEIIPLKKIGKFVDSIPIKVLGPYQTEYIKVGIKGYVTSKESKQPQILFENTFVNLNKIHQGESYKCRFYFKNIGEGNLIIKQVICNGKVDYPTKEILPGEDGIIMATVVAQGNTESYREYLDVIINGENDEKIQLVIKGKFSK